MNIAVLISGSGSNMEAIAKAIQNKKLKNVSIIDVIADRECWGINKAIDRNLPYAVISRARSDFYQALLEEIPIETDYIVLAGFLSILSPSFVKKFPRKIINIHPSLLPKYGGDNMYGIHVHEAVIQNKEKVSGCTVHFVDYGIDTGQIILQREVPVDPEDNPRSLQRKILEQEHQLLPFTLQYLQRAMEQGIEVPEDPINENYAQQIIEGQI